MSEETTEEIVDEAYDDEIPVEADENFVPTEIDNSIEARLYRLERKVERQQQTITQLKQYIRRTSCSIIE